MSQTLEKTIYIDRDLARRAERKFRRYGTSIDGVLSILVSTRGLPSFLVPKDVDDDADMVFDNVEDAIDYLHANV